MVVAPAAARVSASTIAARRSTKLADDLALGAQRFVVGLCVRDPEVGPREEPVAAGQPIGVEAERLNVNHVRAVQREQAMGRAHELDVVVIATHSRVAHDLRDRKLFERVVEGTLQALLKGTPCCNRAQEHRLRLAVGLDGQVVGAIGIRPSFGEEAAAHSDELSLQRERRLAVGAERHRFRHQLLRERFVRRTCEHMRDRDGEPPGCGERRDGARGGLETAFGEPGDDSVGERLAESLQRLRRQLLGEELDDERCDGGIDAHAARTRNSTGSIGKPSASREST